MEAQKTMDKKQLYLSASRIKTYLGCSWKYWASYKLKVPDIGNFGQKRGSVCHDVFELLLDKKYKSWYDHIIKNKTCVGHKNLEEVIGSLRKKYDVTEQFDDKNQDNGLLIDTMIYNGCVYDFFCEGWDLQDPEEGFEFINQDPYYALKGFIDKYARSKKKALIRDYKSSKNISAPDHKLQGLLYSLYLLKKKQLRSYVEFQFLRFPDNPIVRFEFDEDELLGVEEWLEEIQLSLENFDEEDAYKHFAYSDGWPAKGEGFKGAALCGYGKFPGHSYADNHKDPDKRGKEYWVCAHKWPVDYYALIEGEEIIQTSFEKKDLKKKKGQVIKKMNYSGCPKFNNSSNNGY